VHDDSHGLGEPRRERLGDVDEGLDPSGRRADDDDVASSLRLADFLSGHELLLARPA